MDIDCSIEEVLEQARRLAQACRKALERLSDKIVKQETERDEARRFLSYQQWADTLLRRPDGGQKGGCELTIKNIHTGVEQSISLNPKLSVHQNAQLYFKKAKKGKRGLEISEKKLTDSYQSCVFLEETLKDLKSVVALSGNESEACALLKNAQQRLLDAGFDFPIQKTQQPGAPTAASVPYRTYRFDEWTVLVGKTDAQNDELTTRIARSQDVWMHVAGYSGSHVVIRREKNTEYPPKEILTKTASLAVWFSKAKHTSSCEVHYTEARYVQKRRKSPAGEVVLLQWKSLRAAPVSPQAYFPGEYA